MLKGEEPGQRINQLLKTQPPSQRLEEALNIMAKVKQRADLRDTWQRWSLDLEIPPSPSIDCSHMDWSRKDCALVSRTWFAYLSHLSDAQ
jgi:hypothetical protein